MVAPRGQEGHAAGMWDLTRTVVWAALVFGVSACGSVPQPDTGGTDVARGPFGRGLVIIDTDYQSTNVSLLGLDGALLSRSFTSSYEDHLSWDIATPTMPSTGEDIVLLDRAFGLVTWLDVKTSDVREQFHVDGDDLAKNPWDYLPVSPEKAYVTRYDPVPGESHGDVIVVNPATANVTAPVDKRIPIAPLLSLSKGHVVHPARGVVVGDRAYVTTVNATPEYEYTTSYVVAIDTKTDEVTDVKELSGLWDCTGIVASPDKSELAVICSGDLLAPSLAGGDPSASTDRSALVLLSAEDLSEKKRIPADKLSVGPLGLSLSYASERTLVFSSFGASHGDTDDVARAVDLDTEEVRELRRTAPVQIGAVLCPERADGAVNDLDPETCFVTDADDFVVLRFPVEEGSIGSAKRIDVDEGRGRPPRYLGQF